MNQSYAVFKKFPDFDQAKEVSEFLTKNGIPTILGDNVPPVDITFSGNTIQHQIEIRIQQKDFEKAQELLEKQAKILTENIEEDYYLLDFTNEELYEILLNADEWNEFDYVLAQKLLTERGKPISKELLDTLKAERIKKLAKPDEGQTFWIVLGYIFSILGGFVGIIIGYFLMTSKKTLPNGQKVYSYKKTDRTHGTYIFYLGIITVPVLLIYKVFDL